MSPWAQERSRPGAVPVTARPALPQCNRPGWQRRLFSAPGLPQGRGQASFLLTATPEGWIGGLGGLGGTLLPPVMGMFVDHGGHAGYATGFITFAGLCVVSLAIITVLRLTRPGAIDLPEPEPATAQ